MSSTDLKQNAAGLFLDILHEEYGVEVIFGLPGDGINGIMEALRQRQDKIRFIQVRHEEAAAFMACSYAKWTEKLGVCLATSGPGGLHLLNGLYDAKMDRQPVLAITGLPFHDLIGTFTQQDVQLDHVFQDVAVYNTRIMGPTHVENVTRLAASAALGYRGVAHIAFPNNFQAEPVEPAMRSPRNKANHEGGAPGARGKYQPDPKALQQAADILNSGQKTFILVGRGGLHATDELLAVAEQLGAPIGKALLGKAAIPDDNPYTTGSIGYLGTDASQKAMDECDTLLMVGSSFPYLEYLPKPGQAKCVQIDTDPLRIGLRHPADVGLIGDSKEALAALLPLLTKREDQTFLSEIQQSKAEWEELLLERATHTATPMKPQVVAHELGQLLADDAILASDSGANTLWWARHIPARGTQMHSVSGLLASMGCGLPYAIAGQIAYPNRQCVAFVGDGGFCMLMAEFLTCVKYKLPVKIVVVNNASLAYIRWEQMLNEGNPEFGVELQDMDYAAFARACGGTGFRITDPAQCRAVLAEALTTPGPVIVDAVVDPFEPTTPPKLSKMQAEHFQQALEKGQPMRSAIEKTELAQRAEAAIASGG